MGVADSSNDCWVMYTMGIAVAFVIYLRATTIVDLHRLFWGSFLAKKTYGPVYITKNRFGYNVIRFCGKLGNFNVYVDTGPCESTSPTLASVEDVSR